MPKYCTSRYKENVPAYNLYKKLNFITTSEIIYYDNL